MKKVFITILVLIIFLFCNTTTIYAANSDFISIAKNWLKLGKDNQNGFSDWTDFNDLVGILWVLGIFVVLVVGTILGIKYMFSSVEEQASIKTSIQPFIIGAVIILGALGIWKFLVEFLDGIL